MCTDVYANTSAEMNTVLGLVSSYKGTHIVRAHNRVKRAYIAHLIKSMKRYIHSDFRDCTAFGGVVTISLIFTQTVMDFMFRVTHALESK